jgi:hypothetical protein
MGALKLTTGIAANMSTERDAAEAIYIDIGQDKDATDE